MATIYTRRIAGSGVLPPSPTLLYTAGPSEHVVLRDVLATVAGGGPGSMLLYVATLDVGNLYLYYLSEIPELETQHLELRQELQPGESLYGHSSVGSWHVLVTAYVFR